MKKIITLILLIFILSIYFVSYGANSAYDGVVKSKTVISDATLLYSEKFGANYKNSPTPPVVVGDTIIVASGKKLYKMKAEDGTVIKETDMAESNMYSVAPLLYAEGKIFVQLDNGTIQAFSFENLESLWIYKDKLGGQSLTPITYSYGYIYTGFWNGEDEKANYVCLSAKDENPEKTTEIKLPRWTYKAKGGFYGAGCTVTEKFVVFGRDDGERQSNGKSEIISLYKETGKLADTVSLKGDIRSSVVYSETNKAYYVSSKSGYVYKFRMNSQNGNLKILGTYITGGSITATPVIYNGRLYVGASNGRTGELLVVDADTMKLIYSGETAGYSQASVLVSTGYEEETDKIYIYLTCNTKPGGIYVFEDSENSKAAEQSTLFTPDGSMSEYCISTISADDKGNLYYKNDSGNIFAVGKAKGKITLFERILQFLICFFRIITGNKR